MCDEGAFANPLILKSEHKRILAATQERCDASLKAATRIGYWQALTFTFWMAIVCSGVALLTGFTFGLYFQ